MKRDNGFVHAKPVKEATIQALIQQENSFINHRMNWMWTLQGLLFTALAVLWDKADAVAATSLICATGFISCLSIGYSLRCSVRALRNLQRTTFSRVVGLGVCEERFHFLLPWNLLPLVMGVVWIAMFVVNLQK
ncbi:MAG: hypothetical protein AAFQ63_05215 [Cyanobacteria bacterium J06621_11]